MSTAKHSAPHTWLHPSRKVGLISNLLGAIFFFGLGLFLLVTAPTTDVPWLVGTLAIFPFAIGFVLLLQAPEVTLAPYAALVGAVTLVIASGGIWYAVEATAQVQATQLALDRSTRIAFFVDRMLVGVETAEQDKADLIRKVSALSDEQLCDLMVLSRDNCPGSPMGF